MNRVLRLCVTMWINKEEKDRLIPEIDHPLSTSDLKQWERSPSTLNLWLTTGLTLPRQPQQPQQPQLPQPRFQW